MITKGSTNLENLNELKKQNEKIINQTNFNFLYQHNGFRPSQMHVLLGTSGGGKSSVVRSLIIDYLKNNTNRIFVWLSEESKNSFLIQLKYSGLEDFMYDRILLYSEVDNTDTDLNLFPSIENIAQNESVDLFVFDNITTSKYYADKKPDDQSKFCNKLKNIFANSNQALLLVAHTQTGVFDNMPRLITRDDVRGSRSIVNLSEFWYTLQRFETEVHIFQTLRIEKHRSQEVEDKLFFLEWDQKQRIYFRDRPISFADFKKVFKNRNQLSGK